LHKYQWDEERTWRLGINWFEDGSEGEYVDENCFKDFMNYPQFKVCYEPLALFPLFNEVFDIIKTNTRISYCFSEMAITDALGKTYHPKVNSEVFIRNKKTNEVIPFIDYLTNKNSDTFGKPEDLRGMITINMGQITSKTIFHELNHAAQNVLKLIERAKYSDAAMEVETRMILYYSVFKKADEQTRKDKNKMKDLLALTYGAKILDLYPLIGNFYATEGQNPCVSNASYLGYITDADKYGLIYSYFYYKTQGLSNEKVTNDFNVLMRDYARWLVQVGNYEFDDTLFNPDFFLLDKL